MQADIQREVDRHIQTYGKPKKDIQTDREADNIQREEQTDRDTIKPTKTEGHSNIERYIETEAETDSRAERQRETHRQRQRQAER